MLAGLFSKKQKKEMNWNILTDVSMLDEIDEKSFEKPVLIFKHSTRCSISSMVLNKFERNYHDLDNFEIYFLDLIANREVSNEIESRYGIIHQSPQAILIKEGKAIYDQSHTGINYDAVDRKASKEK